MLGFLTLFAGRGGGGQEEQIGIRNPMMLRSGASHLLRRRSYFKMSSFLRFFFPPKGVSLVSKNAFDPPKVYNGIFLQQIFTSKENVILSSRRASHLSAKVFATTDKFLLFF